MTLATVVPGKRGGMGCYISDPPPPPQCPTNGMWVGLGWVTSPLRNLRLGSVAVSQKAWPHVHSGFFKGCGLGWDAELEERLVVVCPFSSPWDFGESFCFTSEEAQGYAAGGICCCSLFFQPWLGKCPEPCMRSEDLHCRPPKANQTGLKETASIKHVVLALSKRTVGAQSQLP